ncbi:MAG: hypothetical protein K9L64_04340 [Candidatus Izimaplasma sp.]|nr:hypothetical protein [Candidatus Izimaplasma bacterium]
MPNLKYLDTISLLPNNNIKDWSIIFNNMKYLECVAFQFPHYTNKGKTLCYYTMNLDYENNNLNPKLNNHILSTDSHQISNSSLINIANIFDDFIIKELEMQFRNNYNEVVDYDKENVSMTIKSINTFFLYKNSLTFNKIYCNSEVSSNLQSIINSDIHITDISLNYKEQFLTYFHLSPFISSIFIIPEYLIKKSSDKYECKFYIKYYNSHNSDKINFMLADFYTDLDK